MKIALVDVDGRRFPNLALMRLSAWHKARGDSVEWWSGFTHYGRVYQSKVFTFTPDFNAVIDEDEIINGGTGYMTAGRSSSWTTTYWPRSMDWSKSAAWAASRCGWISPGAWTLGSLPRRPHRLCPALSGL